MDKVIYKSIDRAIISMIENAFRDNQIPCVITGGSDVGLINPMVEIRVSEEYATLAQDIVDQITGN